MELSETNRDHILAAFSIRFVWCDSKFLWSNVSGRSKHHLRLRSFENVRLFSSTSCLHHRGHYLLDTAMPHRVGIFVLCGPIPPNYVERLKCKVLTRGVFRWTILVEETNDWSWLGIVSSLHKDELSMDSFLGNQERDRSHRARRGIRTMRRDEASRR
jgi:hypothetical protein